MFDFTTLIGDICLGVLCYYGALKLGAWMNARRK